jgi:hypothetical protein
MNDAEIRRPLIVEWTEGRAKGLSDLGFIDAMNIINYLTGIMRTPKKGQGTGNKGQGEADKEELTMDKKRKGLIKAVFRWLELQGKTPSMAYVKKIICRAGSVSNMNDLSAEALTRLYAEFCRKQTAQQAMKKDEFLRFSNN